MRLPDCVPVPAKPVRRSILLSIALHCNDMHLRGAVAAVSIDAASICLKLRGDTDATGNWAPGGNLSNHCLFTLHLACTLAPS